jgi:hypothetical protein
LDKENPVIVVEVAEPNVPSRKADVLAIEEPGNTWYKPMWDYLSVGILPEDKVEARRLKKIAPLYSIFNGQLYKRGYLRPWLRCIPEDMAKAKIVEVHEGLCGSHQGAKTVAKRILRAGFYWPTMQHDTADLVKRCEKCQFHSKLCNIPAYGRVNISGA